MKNVAALVALITGPVLAILGASPAAAQATEFDELDAVVEERLKETRTPGAALAVIDGTEVVHEETWGSDGNGDAVTAETPFLWGSVAKPITSTLVLTLVEDGDIELAAPAQKYLPGFRPTWNGEPASPTVKQLLTHTAGMPSNQEISAALDQHAASDTAVTDMAQELNDVRLVYETGGDYLYSSGDYLVLGAIVEAVTGQGFGDAVRERLFDPLRMDVITRADDRLPPGYRQYGGFPVEHAVEFDRSGVPYGYMAGGLDDLSRFTAAMLGGGQLDGTRILTQDSVRLAWESTVKSSGQYYGLGWSVGTLGESGEPVVWHSGSTPEYQAMVVILPERDRAVVIVQNTFSIARDAELLNAAMDAAALMAGTERETYAPTTWMLYLPWIALVLTGALLAWAALTFLRNKGGKRSALRAVVWICVAAAVATALLVLLPTTMAGSLGVLFLWAPDLAWSLVGVSAAFAMLALARAASPSRGGSLSESQ